jgi:hypothetical protein
MSDQQDDGLTELVIERLANTLSAVLQDLGHSCPKLRVEVSLSINVDHGEPVLLCQRLEDKEVRYVAGN